MPNLTKDASFRPIFPFSGLFYKRVSNFANRAYFKLNLRALANTNLKQLLGQDRSIIDDCVIYIINYHFFRFEQNIIISLTRNDSEYQLWTIKYWSIITNRSVTFCGQALSFNNVIYKITTLNVLICQWNNHRRLVDNTINWMYINIALFLEYLNHRI